MYFWSVTAELAKISLGYALILLEIKNIFLRFTETHHIVLFQSFRHLEKQITKQRDYKQKKFREILSKCLYNLH